MSAVRMLQVMELMSRDFGQLAHITCSVQRQKWSLILDCIKLTPSQREAMMVTRKEHLNKLRATYQERQELNFKVSCIASVSAALSIPVVLRHAVGAAGAHLQAQLHCTSLTCPHFPCCLVPETRNGRCSSSQSQSQLHCKCFSWCGFRHSRPSVIGIACLTPQDASPSSCLGLPLCRRLPL